MLNWGIIGTGKIAETFAKDLSYVENARLSAVGSRTIDKARDFAHRFQIVHSYGSYEELVQSPYINAVYIATPHSMHAENMQMALQAGKPILCEKPFTVNGKQAISVLEQAKNMQILVVEGMWTYFQPVFQRCVELVQSGWLGEVISLEADASFKSHYDPSSRLFDPKLGGGALLDVGVYNLALMTALLGKPKSINARSTMAPTGVDSGTLLECDFDSNRSARLSCNIMNAGRRDALVKLQNGSIHIPSPWWHFSKMNISHEDGSRETINSDRQGYGFVSMIREFMSCYEQGKTESSVMPWERTLLHMQILDEIALHLTVPQ